MIDVIWLRGTTENMVPESVSMQFLDKLNGGFQVLPIQYQASYGNPGSYHDSRIEGRDNALVQIRNSQNPFIIGGYSQGADIAGDLLAEILGWVSVPGRVMADDLVEIQHRCRGGAFIADPQRPTNRYLGLNPDPGQSSYGIKGSRDITARKAFWVAAPRDPITVMRPGNPARSIADFSDFFALSTPEDATRWGLSIIQKALSGQAQPWWLPEHWKDWGGAIEAIANYLGTRHTTAYVEEGFCEMLANAVNGYQWVA
jgi:hypothetical protein